MYRSLGVCYSGNFDSVMRDNSLQMQNRSFDTRTAISTAKTSTHKSSTAKATPAKDDLSRTFNTALVSTQAGGKRDFSHELFELTQQAPFKAILSAVRQLARVQGIDERLAAEQVIETFRKVDNVWKDYVFQEGLDRIRGPRR